MLDRTASENAMADAPAYLYDVFLSHNSRDKPLVLPIARALRAAGLSVFYDDWVMPPGRRNNEQIDQGMADSAWVLVFLGPHHFGPVHFDEADRARDLERREGKGAMKVLLPGVDAQDQQVKSYLSSLGHCQFNTVDERETDFLRAVWELQWGITSVKPPGLQALHDGPPAGTPTLPAALRQTPPPGVALLQDFDRGRRASGIVLLLGRSWDLTQGGDEPKRLARRLLPEVVGDISLPEPARPSLDEIASCVGDLAGDDRVTELVQDALDPPPARRANPDREALGDFLRRWLACPSTPNDQNLLLVSTAMGLDLEALLVKAAIPFVRVVLQGLTADPRLLVLDALDMPAAGPATGLRERLGACPVRDGPATTAQLGDLLPQASGRRHVMLVKWMGSVDVPESCLLTRGQLARFSELLGRGSSLRLHLDSALVTRAVLMAGLRVLDEDFAQLRSLVLDPAFRKAAPRVRLWFDPGCPAQDETLAELVEREHGERLRRRLQLSLLGVSAMEMPLGDALQRIAQPGGAAR